MWYAILCLLGVIILAVLFEMLFDVRFAIQHYLTKKQWYRRRKGGKWSRQFIEVCGSYIWFNTWERQPCSTNMHLIEKWPDNNTTQCECCGYNEATYFMCLNSYETWGITDDTVYLNEKGQMFCGYCREELKDLNRLEW